MGSNNKHFVVKYFECRHNHAARSMGHVLDGCGEFCPTGPPETPESFICAACHCHRNFHRKVKVEVEVEVENGVELPPSHHGTHLVIIDGPPPRAQLGDKFEDNNVEDDTVEKEIEGGEIQVRKLKRKYTTSGCSSSEKMKLSPYQKERVLVFAQDIMEWKWSKYNEQVIPFCTEIGITPLFLKNWINNNRRRIGPLKKNI